MVHRTLEIWNACYECQSSSPSDVFGYAKTARKVMILMEDFIFCFPFILHLQWIRTRSFLAKHGVLLVFPFSFYIILYYIFNCFVYFSLFLFSFSFLLFFCFFHFIFLYCFFRFSFLFFSFSRFFFFFAFSFLLFFFYSFFRFFPLSLYLFYFILSCFLCSSFLSFLYGR